MNRLFLFPASSLRFRVLNSRSVGRRKRDFQIFIQPEIFVVLLVYFVKIIPEAESRVQKTELNGETGSLPNFDDQAVSL